MEVLPAPRNPASKTIGMGFFVLFMTPSIEEEGVDDTAVVVMYRFSEKTVAAGIDRLSPFFRIWMALLRALEPL